MQTLSDNYKSNVIILKENLKRGMTIEQSNHAVNNMESQFISAKLYGSNEKTFINTMRAEIINHFSHLTVTTN